MTNKNDTFATSHASIKWIIAEMDNYYKPDIVEQWNKLKLQLPIVSLDYPLDWTYRVDNSNMFDKKNKNENRLVIKDKRGLEIVQIIRTPNKSKQSTQQIMELSAMMNRAIDLKQNPPLDIIIDGKTFKTIGHTFMEVMLQRHYWYADDNEIIYIGYGLLKDQRIKYSEIIKHIMEVLKW